jgi:hypothetical protein
MFAGDRSEAGTAAQTSAALMEANRLSFFMTVSRLSRAKLTDQLLYGSLEVDETHFVGDRV